jgi:hypothetical protein
VRQDDLHPIIRQVHLVRMVEKRVQERAAVDAVVDVVKAAKSPEDTPE